MTNELTRGGRIFGGDGDSHTLLCRMAPLEEFRLGYGGNKARYTLQLQVNKIIVLHPCCL